MANPVTITQIAETAGVSTATVDRVLNNRPGVNPDHGAQGARGGGRPRRGRAGAGASALHVELPLRLRAAGHAARLFRSGRSRDRSGGRRFPTSTHHRDHAPHPGRRSERLCGRARQAHRSRWHCPARARRAADQARDQRAGAGRGPCGDAVLRRARLDARDGDRRRQPRRRPYCRLAARSIAAARTGSGVRTVLAGDSLCGGDRSAHRFPAGDRRALPARAGETPVRAAGIGGRGLRIRARDADRRQRRSACRCLQRRALQLRYRARADRARPRATS